MRPTRATAATSIELNADEFHAIFGELKECLERDFNWTDGSTSSMSGPSIPSEHARFDFTHGFLPLYLRLEEAARQPVETEEGTIFRVRFG